MKEKYYFTRGKMLNLILIYFSTNLHFLSANSLDFAELPVKEYRSLAFCIRDISKRDLFWRPTIVFKVEKNQAKAKSDFVNEVTRIFSKEYLPYASSLENHTFDGNQGNYLIADYFDDSIDLLKFDFDAVQKKVKYLLILENYSESFRSGGFESIGNKVGKYDVSFLLKGPEADYKLLTFIPRIVKKTCKETLQKAFVINTCKDGYLLKQQTFPKKQPDDLMGCPFKVGLSTLYPFSMIKNQKPLKPYDSLENIEIQGMDVDIVKIITEYFNAKLEWHYIFKDENNPYIATDYIPLLLNGSLDACAGGLYRIFGDIVEYSGVYARQSIVWLYTADRLTTSWQNLVANIDGLYIFMIFYIGYSVTWYTICVFDHKTVSLKSTLLYSWGALVGTASLPDPKSFKQKVVNLVYLIMCLHLSVYISIQFYSFLTIQAAPEIFKTNDDVMNSGRTPYLHSVAKYFVTDDKYLRFANTSANCNSFADCTMKSLKNKGMTVVLEAYLIYFQAETAVNDEARLLRAKENLLVVYYEMIINKDNPMVFKFQMVIRRLFEAGITVKLFQEAIGITKVHKTKRVTQNIMSSSYSCQEGCTITFEQVSGVFYLWAIGCGIALALFIFELLYKKEMKNIERRAKRRMLIIENIIVNIRDNNSVSIKQHLLR